MPKATMANEPTNSPLHGAKKVAPTGVEYWRAREIQGLLGYKTWENFEAAIARGMESCRESGGDVQKHFRETTKMVDIGSGAKRPTRDYFIDRYGCYLVAMNGDPSIKEIAEAQQYFAIQTRKQELREAREARDELDLRLEERDRLTVAVKELNKAASEAGVKNFAFWNDAGYMGLYEMRLSEIKERKGLGKDKLYDRAGRAELAANAFHKTQTEETLKRRNIQGQKEAEQVYREVGQDVRAVIRNRGGTMPEDMNPEPSLAKLESERNKALKRLNKGAKP
jgi:DNA-damage-inducible protein D